MLEIRGRLVQFPLKNGILFKKNTWALVEFGDASVRVVVWCAGHVDGAAADKANLLKTPLEFLNKNLFLPFLAVGESKGAPILGVFLGDWVFAGGDLAGPADGVVGPGFAAVGAVGLEKRP